VVQHELSTLALGVDADELHGSLCGFLAAGGELAGLQWPQKLALEGIDQDRLMPDRPLAQLLQASIEQLDDQALGFQLLLPDSAPLDARAEALLAWCRGFLGGFGLARGSARSEDAQEALTDLGRIAGTVLSFEDPEQDAESLEELVEFVRVAVLLLHDDGPPPAATHTTLH
jgi:uncharacterized protein YgfB (UPF0149 family)